MFAMLELEEQTELSESDKRLTKTWYGENHMSRHYRVSNVSSFTNQSEVGIPDTDVLLAIQKPAQASHDQISQSKVWCTVSQPQR